MSEENTAPQTDELELLKARATQMNIKFHPNIGLDALREKVNSALAGDQDQEEATPAVAGSPAQKLREEALKLVRIRVACMNPNKKEWEGEFFSAGNSIIPTQTKFVPFNVDEGYHVPNIIYKAIKNRKCQVFYTTKGPRGEKYRKGKLINEFNVEVLPPLTKEELAELAQRQAMSHAID